MKHVELEQENLSKISRPSLPVSPSLITRIVVCFFLGSVLLSARNEQDQPTVEIKCLLPEEKAAAFSEKVNLKSRAPFTRVVCFFDTASLSLFRHEPKVVLRSRYDSSDKTDTTVKVRNGNEKVADAQCEFDKVLGKEKIVSCSITDKEQRKKEIKKANAGGNVKKIFSKRQEAALEAVIGKMDWQSLRPYGPVKRIQVWKDVKVRGAPDLTVERWELPVRSSKPAPVLFEVSAKVPLAEEDKASKEIAELVGLTGSDEESETKTRVVLEYFKSGTP
jgi:hypothetical protein